MFLIFLGTSFYKNVLNISNTDKATKYSADEALALIIDASLTKASYQLIRSGALEKEYNIYFLTISFSSFKRFNDS